MSVRLLLASWWTPRSILERELVRVAKMTTGALDSLLKVHAPSAYAIPEWQRSSGGSFAERRASMAKAHNVRVKALSDALGPEEAIQIGRESMFKVGVQLGQDARRRLGVGDGMKDLMRAARILYKVLGIEFKVEWHDGRGATMRVSRCSLADHYSADACRILSATDEGVVKGLNPNVSMIFVERITSGSPICTACIDRVVAEGKR